MTCLIGIRHASRLEEWHKAFVHHMPHSGVMWLSHACDEAHSWVTQLIRIRHAWVTFHVTRSCVWFDAFTCNLTHSHVWYDSFMNASLLVLGKTEWRLGNFCWFHVSQHASACMQMHLCVNESWHTFEWIIYAFIHIINTHKKANLPGSKLAGQVISNGRSLIDSVAEARSSNPPKNRNVALQRHEQVDYPIFSIAR